MEIFNMAPGFIPRCIAINTGTPFIWPKSGSHMLRLRGRPEGCCAKQQHKEPDQACVVANCEFYALFPRNKS